MTGPWRTYEPKGPPTSGVDSWSTSFDSSLAHHEAVAAAAWQGFRAGAFVGFLVGAGLVLLVAALLHR